MTRWGATRPARARARAGQAAPRARAVGVVALTGVFAGCRPEPASPGAVTDRRASGERERSGQGAAPAALAEGELILIGVLEARGHRRCPDPAEPSSLGPWEITGYAIGLVPLELDDAIGAQVEPLVGAPVIARGEALDGLAPRSRPREPCAAEPPVAQMRSDWRDTPSGILIDRWGEKPLPALRTRALARWDGLSVVDTGAELEWSLAALPEHAPEPELWIHYEGCMGKPGTLAVQAERLKPGVGQGELRWRSPRLQRVEGGHGSGDFSAATAELRGAGPRAIWHYDLALAALGVEIECPVRERGER